MPIKDEQEILVIRDWPALMVADTAAEYLGFTSKDRASAFRSCVKIGSYPGPCVMPGEPEKWLRSELDRCISEQGHDSIKDRRSVLDQALQLTTTPDKLAQKAGLEETLNGQPVLLYFFRNPRIRLIKIGISFKPLKRIMALEAATGCELQLIAYNWGSRYAEGRLHQAFRNYRAKGEWFRESAKLLRAAELHHESGIRALFSELQIK